MSLARPAARFPTAFWLALAAWVLVMIATPLAAWQFGDSTFAWMASLGVLAQLSATLAALNTRWRPGRWLGTLAQVALLTSLVEWTGVQTGQPFGSYTYTNLLQPQLLGVPLLIPLAWMMMLPPAWAVARAALAPHAHRLGRFYPWAFAALAGLAFTAWDLYLDPQMVARGLWQWHAPGAYFGIPWSNYLGWWLASSLLTLVVRPSLLPTRPLYIIYTLTWLFQALGLGVFWGQPGPALAGFLGMGLFAVLARRGWLQGASDA